MDWKPPEAKNLSISVSVSGYIMLAYNQSCSSSVFTVYLLTLVVLRCTVISRVYIGLFIPLVAYFERKQVHVGSNSITKRVSDSFILYPPAAYLSSMVQAAWAPANLLSYSWIVILWGLGLEGNPSVFLGAISEQAFLSQPKNFMLSHENVKKCHSCQSHASCVVQKLLLAAFFLLLLLLFTYCITNA